MKQAIDPTMRYTVHPYLRRRWDRVGRALAFRAKSERDWRTWHTALSRKLKELTGYASMVRAPLKPKILGESEEGDYRRQQVELQTEPDVIATLDVLIPKSGPGPWPAVLAPHGHCSGGKLAVTGRRDTPELDQTITAHNYDYGVQLVRSGFIVFCPDARGFGARQEKAAQGNILNSSCQWINNMAVPLGQTVTGMWAWDLHRIIDYIETRGDCRSDRIGCAGLSGGGLQTLWAAALDPRIRCAVISGYLYGYRESLLDLHMNCSCNYVPHLYEVADMGDIGALIAPRPVLVETGTRDPLNGASGLKNVVSQVNVMRRAYRMAHAPKAIYHDIFEGEHRWNGVVSIPWMQRWLGSRG